MRTRYSLCDFISHWEKIVTLKRPVVAKRVLEYRLLSSPELQTSTEKHTRFAISGYKSTVTLCRDCGKVLLLAKHSIVRPLINFVDFLQKSTVVSQIGLQNQTNVVL